MTIPVEYAIRADCRKVLDGPGAEALVALRGKMLFVTGGTGFLGTWISEIVACLNDDFSFGARLVLFARNCGSFQTRSPHLGQRKDIEFADGDIRYSIDLPKDTSYVIHAASTPDTRFHASLPVDTMAIIGMGTISMIRSLSSCSGLTKFLHVSSGLANGVQPLDLARMPESYIGSMAQMSSSCAYAGAKRFAETLCAAALSQEHLPVVVARPFAFVGPYQPSEAPWAINSFIRHALGGHPISIAGDGKTVRSYMYGADFAYWILRLLVSGGIGKVYNVGSSEGISLHDLAALIAERFEPRPGMRIHTSPSSMTQRSILVPDTSLAERELGLARQFGLAEAIDRTIEWQRAVMSRMK